MSAAGTATTEKRYAVDVTQFTFCNKNKTVSLIVCQMLLRWDHILKKEKMPVHIGLQRKVNAIVEALGWVYVRQIPTAKVNFRRVDL